MMRGRKKYQLVTSRDVCLVYEFLRKRNQVEFPVTNEAQQKVDALVSNIVNLHFGEEFYKTIEEKVVAYLYFLIKDHPFIDGNKRTAVLTFFILCSDNDLSPNTENFPLDELAVFIEKTREPDHHMVIRIIAETIFN
jgi:prophage maintenance system killer protein